MNNAPSSRYVIISVVTRASPGQNQNQYWIERDGVVLKASFESLDKTVAYIEADKRRSRVIGFRALPFIRILSAIVALVLAASAHADLGDTYAQSCERYGGPGISDKTLLKGLSKADRVRYGERMTCWKIKRANVVEVFKRDQVVYITYLPLEAGTVNGSFTEWEIWDLLKKNARPTHEWHEYSAFGVAKAFVTSDDKLYAALTREGYLLIGYKSWMKANYPSLDQAPDRYSLPPSERDGELAK